MAQFISSTSLIPEVTSLYPKYATADLSHYNKEFFDKRNLEYMSTQITRLLIGVHPENKNIIVPDQTIISVMESIFENNPRTSCNIMSKMVITYIVNYIKTEYETITQNDKLDIEVIKYTGEYSIRRVPMIKLNNRRPTPFLIQMRY